MDNILTNIRTKQEAEEVIAALENFSATLFMVSQEKNDFFSRLHPNLAAPLMDMFTKPTNETNRETIRQQIQELQEKIRKCKRLQMMVAFKPDEQTISLFSSWVKTNAGKDFLIDLQIDKTLIAGAIITANGLHKDYSLQKKLSDVFRLQREEILGTLI